MSPVAKTDTALLADLRGLIEQARQHVAQTANSTLTLLYWQVGQRIRREILTDGRAGYGQQILATLSQELVRDYGKGFNPSALTRMIKFAEVFPDEQIVVSLVRQLSWSHFIEILPLKQPLEREYYAELCRVERWSVRTLRERIASQLYLRTAISKKADANGTSPGKDVLCTLLARFAPCVVLLDELVVYIRQFVESQALSGGTYDSNLSFIQSLTEAAKLVPNAVVLASLPESNSQAGGPRGVAALQALESVFNRVQALWKTVAPEEAFEIVRRRLFETIRDAKARDLVCRAFADAYVAEGAKVPQETQEARYFDRMVQSYPIHPEVFTQLYEEWTTIEGFQRTRGVLKLMAKVIFRLWQDNNMDLMILPGSLPLYDGSARNELVYYLGPGWDPVIDRDIDGERSETTVLETRETRFGSVQAARRVARTVFLGSAPSSVTTKPGIRGLDRARVLLGCLQPGQTSSLYSDALNRLADQLHYLNSSGDKALEATRYWFDIRANLRREMEERKKRFEDKNEVRGRMAEVLKKLTNSATFFDGAHIFTPHSDVPDDGALRLIVLAPEQFYSREESRLAFDGVLDHVRNHGTTPRYRGNRLIFLAPDHGALSRLRDCILTALAWNSIVEDVGAMRLVLDNLQAQQAKKELQGAEEVLPRVAREGVTFCHGLRC